MRWAMSSPRPVPWSTGLVVKKASKTRACSSGGDPRAVVADLDADALALRAGAQGDATALGHRVHRVVDQVGPDLVELRARRLDPRQAGVEVPDDLDLLEAQLVAQQRERALEPLVDVDRLDRRLVEVRVAADRADEGGDARRRLLQLGQQDARAGAGRHEAQAGREVGRRRVPPPRARPTRGRARPPSARRRSRRGRTGRAAPGRRRAPARGRSRRAGRGARPEPSARWPPRPARRARRAARRARRSPRPRRRRPAAASPGRQRGHPAGGGRGRVVQLVREPRGERAHRHQLLAVALDPLDRAAHRLDRRQEARAAAGGARTRAGAARRRRSRTGASRRRREVLPR